MTVAALHPAPPPGVLVQQRQAPIDGLRALALLPVIAINWVGYAALPDGGPLAAPQPADSGAAQVALALIAALLAGKGLCLLIFLFGYSQAASFRAQRVARLLAGSVAPDPAQRRGRRMRRLLLLGVLHGVLVYSGDILTAYALSGLLLLRAPALRLRQLRRRLWVWASLSLLITALTLLWFVSDSSLFVPESPRSLAAPNSWSGWWLLNGGHYLLMQLGVVVQGLPLFLGLMTAGLMAGRLRLFTHARWRPLWAAWARRWLVPGLLLNAVWGVGWCWVLIDQDRQQDAVYGLLSLIAALLLLIGLVPWLLMHGQGWLNALAPAGRHTLSMYVGSSLLSLACLSGAGLALPLGTLALAAASLLYWVLWLALARGLGPRRRLPLEAWLGSA
ncbi:hypothetical protein [Roseateles sp.]|uniref:hypothetical protein n=1 Tax=Roseateles sp. TaxID=1971397 RepID=UPI003D100D5A